MLINIDEEKFKNYLFDKFKENASIYSKKKNNNNFSFQFNFKDGIFTNMLVDHKEIITSNEIREAITSNS